MKYNLIEYILIKKKLRQTDLAALLKVSRAQISKWKSGEHIPHNRERQLMDMAGLFGIDPEWAIFAESEENSVKWMEYTRSLYDEELIEYPMPRPISDESELYVPQIIFLLIELGFDVPKEPPIGDIESDENVSKFTSLMCELLDSFAIYADWCDQNLTFYEDNLFEPCMEVYSYLLDMSVGYIDDSLIKSLGINPIVLSSHSHKAEMKVRSLLSSICETMVENGMPLMDDYFILVNEAPRVLEDILLFDGVYKNKNIECYYTQFERNLLAEVSKTNMLLEKIYENLEGRNKG